MIRNALLVLALAAAACSDSAPSVGARLGTPSAIAVFRGVTERRPGVEPYVAVANSGSDQLTLIDPRDDVPVQSPGLVFPLAVPTGASPMFVASASLGDDGADALVAAGAPDPATGEIALQLVATWDGRPRTVGSFPLGAGGDLILSVLGAPIPQDVPPVAGVVPPVAGAARFLVALNAGRLAVVRAERQGDGSIQLREEGTLALGGATPFDAVSLAASPDGRHVYAASLDLVTGTAGGTPVQGVAEIDTVGADPAGWTVRALSARAATYGVAAARVIERSVADADVFNRSQLTNGGRLLVYALPDRTTCGPTRSIDCGILTIDPVTGALAEDPLDEMPYRAPMPLPVLPMTIAVWDRPPVVPDVRDVINTPATETLPLVERPGLRYTPGTGQRATSAIAVATGADGRTYSLDLGRWGPGSDQSLLRSPTQTRVFGLRVFTDPSVDPQIGMWNEADEPTPADPSPQAKLETAAADMIPQMLVTPGYTPNDRWTLGWQYPLTGLLGRRAVLVRDETLGLVVAMQSPEDTGGGTIWRDVVGLYAPQLGVHLDDVVEINLDDAGPLPETCKAVGEGRVASILPPDPQRWPGGALVLGPPVDPPNRADLTRREDVYACWTSELPAGFHRGLGTIISGEWVLVGTNFGNAGRPQPNQPFSVDYPGRGGIAFDEEDLELACAIPSWPPPEPLPACDAACRETCEELAIARRSRRFYYPQEDCQSADASAIGCAVTGRPAQFPEALLVGPVIAFRFGLNPASVNAAHPIVRAANVTWDTASGLAQSYRAPIEAGEPTGGVGFDRSPYTQAEPRIVFYLSYSGDAVYEAAFGAFATESKTIR